MVKRTNRIHNLNRMISEYKREQEKFEVIQKEIFNQQKEIEELRLLVLSCDFMNRDDSSSIKSSRSSDTSSEISPKLSLKPTKEARLAKGHLNKDPVKKVSRKSKDTVEEKKLDVALKPTTKDQASSELRNPKESANQLNTANQPADEIATPFKQQDVKQEQNRLISRTKGLQTITKNVLNQKDNKYLNKFDAKSDGKLLMNGGKELKKGDLLKSDEESDSGSISSKSTELLKKINKLKQTSKFENQENPKEILGINKISKSIKKTRSTVKSSALKSTTKLATSNRALQRI